MDIPQFNGHFFLSLAHATLEKVLTLGQNFETKILIDVHVLRAPESKNHVFSSWSVRAFKINNNKKCKFGILNLYHMEMLLETFYDNRSNSLCTGTHKRILMHLLIDGITC